MTTSRLEDLDLWRLAYVAGAKEIILRKVKPSDAYVRVHGSQQLEDGFGIRATILMKGKDKSHSLDLNAINHDLQRYTEQQRERSPTTNPYDYLRDPIVRHTDIWYPSATGDRRNDEFERDEKRLQTADDVEREVLNDLDAKLDEKGYGNALKDDRYSVEVLAHDAEPFTIIVSRYEGIEFTDSEVSHIAQRAATRVIADARLNRASEFDSQAGYYPDRTVLRASEDAGELYSDARIFGGSRRDSRIPIIAVKVLTAQAIMERRINQFADTVTRAMDTLLTGSKYSENLQFTAPAWDEKTGKYYTNMRPLSHPHLWGEHTISGLCTRETDAKGEAIIKTWTGDRTVAYSSTGDISEYERVAELTSTLHIDLDRFARRTMLSPDKLRAVSQNLVEVTTALRSVSSGMNTTYFSENNATSSREATHNASRPTNADTKYAIYGSRDTRRNDGDRAVLPLMFNDNLRETSRRRDSGRTRSRTPSPRRSRSPSPVRERYTDSGASSPRETYLEEVERTASHVELARKMNDLMNQHQSKWS